jgi:hypothetical protein
MIALSPTIIRMLLTVFGVVGEVVGLGQRQVSVHRGINLGSQGVGDPADP